MAKFGLGGGAGAGAPAGAGGGFFPAAGSPARYDMAKAFLGSALQSAQGSESPWVQALAPLMGAAIGGRLEKQREDFVGQQTAGLTDDLLGTMAADPKARRYLDIISNPNVPDHLRTIASTMLNRTLNPPAVGGGGGGSRKMREDVNGVLRYLDTGEEVFPGVVPNASSPGLDADYLRALRVIEDATNARVGEPEYGWQEGDGGTGYIGMTPEEARRSVLADPYYARIVEMMGVQPPLAAPGGGVTAGGPAQPPAPSDGWVEAFPGVRIREIP